MNESKLKNQWYERMWANLYGCVCECVFDCVLFSRFNHPAVINCECRRLAWAIMLFLQTECRSRWCNNFAYTHSERIDCWWDHLFFFLPIADKLDKNLKFNHHTTLFPFSSSSSNRSNALNYSVDVYCNLNMIDHSKWGSDFWST